MKTSIVIGLGELGSIFALGLLKNGHQVIPILRDSAFSVLAQDHPAPDSVWVCVGEKDIHAVLSTLPEHWKTRLILIQNELLPHDWQQHDVNDPTVISVWFEKKAGKLPQVVQPSVVYGTLSHEVIEVYDRLQLPIKQLPNRSQLLFELVLKNVYIQTTNIAGLVVGGNTQTLVEQHHQLMSDVAQDIIALQEKLTKQSLDSEHLMSALIAACYGDPNHSCMGRSAPARLQRALRLGQEQQIVMPTLQQINQQTKAA